MNYCYNMNFWLLLNSVDPLDQLAWLIETLQQSENKGEKVKQKRKEKKKRFKKINQIKKKKEHSKINKKKN